MGNVLMEKEASLLLDQLMNEKKSPELDCQLKLLRREIVTKPVILIGAGTCGLGAGAAKVIEAVRRYILKNLVEAEILEVGCIGLCSMEPILDVQLPGKNRVSFGHVTADQIDDILDSLLQGNLPLAKVLYQFVTSDDAVWNEVPSFTNHPFFLWFSHQLT